MKGQGRLYQRDGKESDTKMVEKALTMYRARMGKSPTVVMVHPTADLQPSDCAAPLERNRIIQPGMCWLVEE